MNLYEVNGFYGTRNRGTIFVYETYSGKRWYCVDWKIEVFIESTNEKVFEYKFNPTGKHVYIHIDSKAIGDHLAWFPYIEEFRKNMNLFKEIPFGKNKTEQGFSLLNEENIKGIE